MWCRGCSTVQCRRLFRLQVRSTKYRNQKDFRYRIVHKVEDMYKHYSTGRGYHTDFRRAVQYMIREVQFSSLLVPTIQTSGIVQYRRHIDFRFCKAQAIILTPRFNFRYNTYLAYRLRVYSTDIRYTVHTSLIKNRPFRRASGEYIQNRLWRTTQASDVQYTDITLL
jgi:hypothetical protein